MIFRVYVDNTEAYDSGIVTNTTAPIPITIDTTGGSVLRLEVDTAGNRGADHAVWANALLKNTNTAPTTISLAETAIDGTSIGTYAGNDPDPGDSLTYTLAVSYTHLRAHETLRYLVCRLLLQGYR